MKALGVSERLGLERFVSQQIHYTLEAREAEYELVPIAVDQGVGIMVWSPLAGGLLTGKYRRGQAHPPGSRHLTDWGEPPIRDEGRLYDIVATWSPSLRSAAPPRRAWRSPGCSAARASAPWSSASAARSSSPPTSPPPTCS